MIGLLLAAQLVWSGGFGSTSCFYEQGWYTPEREAELISWVSGCMCEETGSMHWEAIRMYVRDHKWVDNRCVVKESWYKFVGGRHIEITKQEYESLRR